MSEKSLDVQVKETIESAIPGAVAEVIQKGHHFEITVTSSAFQGKSLLDKQRLVYSAITPYMSGNNAPIHAVDRLKTLLP